MRKPPPPTDFKWETSVSAHEGWVYVCPSQGMCSIMGGFWPKRVNSPNVIERFLGITFESKVARAVAKSDRFCARQNTGKDEARQALNERVFTQ